MAVTSRKQLKRPGLEWSIVPVTGKHRNLIFQLLAELQGDGKKNQGVVEPGDDTLHFVHVTDFELYVVDFKH